MQRQNINKHIVSVRFQNTNRRACVGDNIFVGKGNALRKTRSPRSKNNRTRIVRRYTVLVGNSPRVGADAEHIIFGFSPGKSFFGFRADTNRHCHGNFFIF